MENIATISLSPENVAEVNDLLAAGQYEDPNEVIKAGLILLREHQKKVAEMKEAIRLGEESGIDKNFNFDQFRKEMREEFSS